MIGKFKLTRVDKVSGERDLIYSDNNQVTEGLKQSLVSVLTGDGSDKVDDYKFTYFQLGDDKYDLNTYDISGDLTSSSFKSYFWNLKSPLNKSKYGYDSKMGVVTYPGYVLGSVLNENAGGGKVLDNFIQPPDIKTVLNEHSNYMPTPLDGDYLNQDATLSSIWDIGCADTWLLSSENRNVNPMPVVPDYSVSGPDFKTPTWKASYTTSRYLLNEDGSNAFSTACLRNSHAYVYVGPVQSHDQGEIQGQYTKLKSNQTISHYVAGKHYPSSVGSNNWPHADASAFSGTNYSGRLTLFSRSLQVLVDTNAGQNVMDYTFRYDYTNPDATYTPKIHSVSSGWQKQEDDAGDALAQFSSIFGLTSEDEYGVVSGNIYNRYGAVYTYADHLNSYSTESGPGAAGSYMDTSNIGFGPSGNFYRVSLTWENASDKMINYYKKLPTLTYDGIILVNFMRPCVSSVSGIDSDGNVSGIVQPERLPRQSANVTLFQYDYDTSASPMQVVHGEESYYMTSSQDFVKLLKDRTTSLNPTTTNVRLEIDENLANSQTLKEVGIYLKNPLGYGRNTPLLAAYKSLSQDINKTDQFSYIIDWEFSFEDEDTSQ